MLGALQGEAHPLRSALSLWAQLASGGIRRLPCPLAPKASYKEVGSGSFTQWPQAQLTMGGAAEEEDKPLLLALISATPSPSPRCPFNWKPRGQMAQDPGGPEGNLVELLGSKPRPWFAAGPALRQAGARTWAHWGPPALWTPHPKTPIQVGRKAHLPTSGPQSAITPPSPPAGRVQAPDVFGGLVPDHLGGLGPGRRRTWSLATGSSRHAEGDSATSGGSNVASPIPAPGCGWVASLSLALWLCGHQSGSPGSARSAERALSGDRSPAPPPAFSITAQQQWGPELTLPRAKPAGVPSCPLWCEPGTG